MRDLSVSLPVTVFLVVFSLNSTGTAFPKNQGHPRQRGEHEQVLLLIKLAKTTKKKEREKRFAEELRLNLDEMDVKEIGSAGPKFGDQSLGKQIASVRPILEKERAVAAIWLTQDSPGLLLLHVVAVSTGRALVRMIETEVESGAEAELAITARELLGTAYLFDLDPSEADTPLGQAVNDVKKQVTPKIEPPAPEPEPEPKPKPKVSFLISAGMSGGMAGHKGPSFLAGGVVALERNIMLENLRVRGGLGAYGGPIGNSSEIDASGFQITGILEFLYLWHFGRLSLGPVVGLQAGLSHLSLRTPEGKKDEFTEWLLRATAKAELRVSLSQSVGLVVNGGIGAHPKRDVFRKKSDNSIVYASPFLSWEVNLGLVIHLN